MINIIEVSKKISVKAYKTLQELMIFIIIICKGLLYWQITKQHKKEIKPNVIS